MLQPQQINRYTVPNKMLNLCIKTESFMFEAGDSFCARQMCTKTKKPNIHYTVYQCIHSIRDRLGFYADI